MKSRMKKIFLLSLFSISLLLSAGCGSSAEGKNGEVIVYNWGEYLDPETIRLFRHYMSSRRGHRAFAR